jgi:4-coumarate--CoA ligase
VPSADPSHTDESTDPKAADLASNYRTLDDLIAELQSLDLPPKPVLTAAESKSKTAFYIFSSGTTGLPKATCISAYSVIANVLQAAGHWSSALPFTPFDSSKETGDKVMGCLPFYHIYGLVVVLHQSIFFATPVVVLRKFSLPNFLSAVERHKISILYVV